ncbi:AAA family ATPase [Streptacidiphilus sp. PB12-B1b]|uniref:ATP-binding protein n=1 Tax=Streptacidiphilus sp. PB12-B1b TaxID=2705012 RepID=UPI0015FDF0A9|nr:AAA family ATPase [Streptacidiphilus sp. PB12-B1b]QMU76549.1 AAA family ATPase [Streptacidiphilus sp. PB12-B1b]
MAEQTPTATGTGLLERDAELAAAERALDALAARSGGRGGGLLVYTGAAGLGKTSLLDRVHGGAAARGLLVLSARGGEQEQLSAFHVVRSLLRPLLGEVGEAGQRELLGGWYEILAVAVGLAADGGDAPAAAPDPQGVRDGLDWVVTHLAVSRGPLVLVVDDAHWADAESLAWLASFAARAEDLPVLLATAYRPDELPPGAEAFRQMAARNGSRPIGLAALTPEAVSAMVHAMYGVPSATEAFCREVWAVTAGNPFETVELVAKAQERGLPPVEASCPQLREAASATQGSGLIARLERLGSAATALAWAVAVLGIHTPLDLAAAVAGQTPAEAADAAERLRTARILTGSQILEFVHPLIATSVYRSIPGELRTGMHARAGWAVLDAGRGPVTAARHWFEVPPQGDDAVVDQLREAAGLFMKAGAPETAQRCLARALQEPPRRDQRAWVLFELGCSTLLYDPASTAGHLRAALAEPGLPEELRVGVTVWLAQSLAHSNQLLEAERVTAEAARTAESRRDWLRLQVWNLMWCAFDAAEQGSAARSARLAELAARIEEEQDTSVAGRYVLGLRAWDAVVRGEHRDTVLHFADLALAGGLSWTDRDWAFEVPVLTALGYMYADRPERCEQLFAAGIAEFEEAGWRGAHLSFAHTILGYARYRCGNLAEAERSARLGLEIANRVGEGLPVHWYAVGTLIAVLVARGSVDEAAALARRYGFHAPYSAAVVFPDAQTVRGVLLSALGDHAGAVAELAEAGERLDAREMRNPGWCSWQRRLASAQAALGRPDLARAIAQDALARAEGFGAASAVAMELRSCAELAGGGERLALLERSVRLMERCSAPYEQALAVFDLARALRAQGQAGRAGEQLRRALELARACAADGLAEQARRELETGGGDLSGED